jgi:mono/diheme cytochrome c family protein
MSAAGEEPLVSLQAAKEAGREKSRFLKPTVVPEGGTAEAAAANVADFQKLVQPLLAKSCSGCHGAKKAEGRLRLDTLDADLLNGPDVERWREVYNALVKAEMPPDDSQEEKLTDQARGVVVQWLGEEIHKASNLRRGTATASSFRRLTQYEYNHALQDLLGLNVSFADKLPPETASEDGFKNRSDLLQMSALQFQTYRELGLSALKRAVVFGERPRPVTYLIPMREQMDAAAAVKNAKIFDPADPNFKRQRNEQHLFDRKTEKGIRVTQGECRPLDGAEFGQTPPVSPVVWVLPQSGEMKLNLDRFLPDRSHQHASR